jgi:hypothetical protein
MPRRDRRLLGDQAARFIELKRQIIAATGQSEDAPRVAYLAVLALRAERIQEAAISGDDIDVAELLALKDTIEQLSPAALHVVTLQISKRLFGICRHCGAANELREEPPPPDDPKLSPLKPPPGP